MYKLQIKWNREFHYSNYESNIKSLKTAKKIGDSMLSSGDGARVKSFRVLDSNDNVIYPLQIQKEINQQHLYTCSFCDKQELGKHISWLKLPNKFSDHKVALMPDGWDWDIVPVKFTDAWSCGCHKFNR